MIEQRTETNTIERRLGKLEKENRWMKRGGCVVLLGIVSAMLMGQARPSRTVEADKFVLKDSNGRTRAEMSFWQDDPLLTFYDIDGKRTLGLSGTVLALGQSNVKGNSYRAKIDLGGLSFVDPDGKLRIVLNAVRPGIGLTDAEGFSANFGRTDVEFHTTGLKLQTSAASINLIDKEGKLLWHAP